MENKRVAFGVCGSFCTFDRAMEQMARLTAAGYRVLPVFSFCASQLDTRFGKARDHLKRAQEITGCPAVVTLQGAEPFGPRDLADAMVIAPCTGATLARLAIGLSDTPVTLAAKSLLRVGRPVVLCPSTNDGLGASARNLGDLLNRRNYYAVPFRQDDAAAKPTSLQSDFDRVEPTLEAALRGRQLQPVLL